MPEALLIRNSFEITSNQFKNANTLGASHSPPHRPVIGFIKDFFLLEGVARRLGEEDIEEPLQKAVLDRDVQERANGFS